MFDEIRDYFVELSYLTPMAIIAAFLPFSSSAILLVFIVPVGQRLGDNWEIRSLVFIYGIMFFCGQALLPTNVIGIVSGGHCRHCEPTGSLRDVFSQP